MKFDPILFYRKSIHQSPKADRIDCTNSYARKVCYFLDGSQEVVSFRYRAVPYQFFHPKKNCTSKNYFDFEITLKDDNKKLLQCIPKDLLADEVMIARIEAMEAEAASLGMPLEIWTEKELFGTKSAYRRAIIEMLC